jgi:hypothetical protein
MIRHRRLLTFMLVALSGCTTAESPTASGSASDRTAPSAPSGAPSGDSEPSASGSAEPGGTAGNILQVVADELRLRGEAGTDATLVDTLARGTTVRAVSDTVEADGFTWIEIVAIDGRRGWAATGDGVDPWLAPPVDLADAVPILTLDRGCDVVGPITMPLTTVFDDGHVVAQDSERDFAWTVRQLSESGMETIREDVLGSPYLRASGEYVPQAKPGAEPPGHGACLYTFNIPTEGEPIVVTSVNWFGDEEESTFYQPSPERKALTGIAENLIDIHNILQDGDWAGAPVPWVASEYAVGIGPQPDPAPEGIPSLEPADLGLGDIAQFRTPMAGDACLISPEQAFEAIRALMSASADLPPSSQPQLGLNFVTFGSFATSDGWMNIVLAPRSHDDRPDCASLPV